MKCPKCHHDNPDDTIFCEECDHRMDQPVRRETATIPPLYAVIIALVLGVVSVICYFLTEEMWYVPVCVGAIGLVLGSYSMTVTRNTPNIDNKKELMILAGAAMGVSVIGFMLGITLI
ncbi:MAG: zinc ribbon domain-containing protein [Methanomassiliicoccaceae archaeon]|nr:zinc ribbon domain-containing protein [Methanomassiliicoccaceae archaeon]